jgi:protein-S-isoprenylcysteine O-methyltransferase Ste14
MLSKQKFTNFPFMKTNKLIRHIAGYIIGISIFGLLIPLGLIGLAKEPFSFLSFSLINSELIRIIVGFLFLIPGLFFSFWSNYALFVIGKGGPADGFGVAVSPRTAKLVIAGPYFYTRNPMVFGAFMCYFSVGIFCNSPSVLFLMLVCIPLVIIYLKLTEEKRLYKDFGDDFLQYRKSVSMLFPLKKYKRDLQ